MGHQQVEEPITLTVKQASAKYGYPVPTLYEMAHGTPGFVRTGRAVRVHRAVFEDWLERQARGEHTNG